jgi:hypothetical protein
VFPMAWNYRSVVCKHKALLDKDALILLQACIAAGPSTRLRWQSSCKVW